MSSGKLAWGERRPSLDRVGQEDSGQSSPVEEAWLDFALNSRHLSDRFDEGQAPITHGY